MTSDEHRRRAMREGAAGQAGGGERWLWLRLLSAAVLAAAAGGLYWAYGDRLSLEYLATQETRLRAFQQRAPLVFYGGAFGIYVIVTGLSIPGALALTLCYGWLMGFAPAFVLVSFASTAGATLAFLLSRFLFRDLLQRRFGDRLRAFNAALEREGALYLFTLRLIPAVPFFVINVMMGLTPMRTRTFWWVSQLGMLPGTATAVWVGTAFPSLQELAERGASSLLRWELILAFSVLGLLPLAMKWLVGWWRARA